MWGHVQDGQGVKVTGDPNVPFNEVSFRVTQPHPLHLLLEDQATTEAVSRATQNYRHYTVSVEAEEDEASSFDFAVPGDMRVNMDMGPTFVHRNMRFCQTHGALLQGPSCIFGDAAGARGEPRLVASSAVLVRQLVIVLSSPSSSLPYCLLLLSAALWLSSRR